MSHSNRDKVKLPQRQIENLFRASRRSPRRGVFCCPSPFPAAGLSFSPPLWDGGTGKGMNNPRYSNGNLRRKRRGRFKAMNAPCGICRGALGPIHYDEPSDAQHPLSFVIDEIKPVSKWRQYGYSSPREAAEDWNNLQAAHYCCNQRKGARVGAVTITINRSPLDGNW